MNQEQLGQLSLCLKALERDFYHSLGRLECGGFPCDAMLTYPQAASRERRPMPEGFVWGGAQKYAWVFADFSLPAAAKGERIVLSLDFGGESTLFLDGVPFGTTRAQWVTKQHHHLVDQTITMNAQGGERFSLAAEVYGGTPLPTAPDGHCATGPVFPEEGVPMTQPAPARIGQCTFGLWNEEAYQLWLDAGMLLDTYETQPEDSYWKEKIGDTLGDMLNQLDMEQPLPMRRAAYQDARDMLAPLMQAHNGTFAPSMAAIANSHLDVAWLWPIGETIRKTARTFAQQLRLLKEYPEARFLQSQCVLYEMCREHYPKLFERILQAIRDGQWIADGAMWVEPDTNLPSGESLVRQFLYGMRYFSQKLGVTAQTVWLPDTFGYSAALPQILAGFGLKGLTTQKIFWSYNDSEAFPYHAFQWKGLDGTAIPCYLHMQYESFVDAKTLCRRWRERVCKDGSGDFLLPFGYGDGGGGPTRDDFEQIRREKDLQGVPKMRYEAPSDFFDTRKDMPAYCGELYFPCHRGTYTTQAAIKQRNRQSENALRSLELWAACAAWKGLREYPAQTIEKLWKELLLNQFHDILPGSGIHEVYVEAHRRYDALLSGAWKETDAAQACIAGEEEGVTLFHAQSCARRQVVALDARFAQGAMTCEGDVIPCAMGEDQALALLTLPPMGHLSLRPWKTDAPARQVFVEKTADGYRLRNDCMEAVLNLRGELVSLVDRKDRQARIGSLSNVQHFYRDVPRAYDAWDIDSQYEQRECRPDAVCDSRIALDSELRVSVCFTTRVLHSTILQTITLDAGCASLLFDTQVDWQERHRLWKVSFDTGVNASSAANQIQFGYLLRPTHRSRVYDRDRFEVCNHAYTALFDATHGAAVTNDCKYGVSMDASVISLSLLRGATSPDPQADRGSHHFCYGYTFWNGPFEQSGLVAESAAINIPLGSAPGFTAAESFIRVDDPAVVVEAVKLAEDSSGDLVARLYESMNGQRRVTLFPPRGVSEIWRCSMLEEEQESVPVRDGQAQLAFRPFEIITLRFKKACASMTQARQQGETQ